MRLGTPRRRVEIAERLGQRVLLAREPGDEVAAHDLAAVLHAEQRVTERRPVALGELAGDEAVAGEQELGARFLALLRRESLVVSEHAPASDHRQPRQHAARLTSPPAALRPAVRRASGRRHAGDDRAEGIGRHHPRPEELPERGQHLGCGEPGRPREVLGERGAPELEMQEDVLDARFHLGRRRRAFAEPADVFSQGGAHARRAATVASGAIEHRPDHLAGEPEAIQPLALVVLHAPGQEVLLPDAHRQIFALQELERGENTGRPDQAMVGM